MSLQWRVNFVFYSKINCLFQCSHATLSVIAIKSGYWLWALKEKKKNPREEKEKYATMPHLHLCRAHGSTWSHRQPRTLLSHLASTSPMLVQLTGGGRKTGEGHARLAMNGAMWQKHALLGYRALKKGLAKVCNTQANAVSHILFCFARILCSSSAHVQLPYLVVITDNAAS